MLGLNPLLLAGVSAVALAGAWWAGNQMAGDARDSQLGKNFIAEFKIERQVVLRREVNLWTQIGDERRARLEMINTFQRIDELSTEARAKMLEAMRQERAATNAALEQARRNIQELKDAASKPALDWKSTSIPDDITCRVFVGRGCPSPADTATGAYPDQPVDVRDQAARADDAS